MSQNRTNISGAIGEILQISLVEEDFVTDMEGPDGIRAWKRGEAFHLIPEEEDASRYQKDPVRKGEPAGQFRKGKHFAEMNTLRNLRNEGFTNWLYGDFELFEPPSGKRKTQRTEIARNALGNQVANGLLEAGRIYRMDVPPMMPSLMAWRDAEGGREFRFISVKRHRRGKTARPYLETIKPELLLGLAILGAGVPNSSVHIYRWINKDMYKGAERREHSAGFFPVNAEAPAPAPAPAP